MPGSYVTVTIAFKIVYKLRALVITVDRQGSLDIARYRYIQYRFGIIANSCLDTSYRVLQFVNKLVH